MSNSVGFYNCIWQGDANANALLSLELADNPRKILNVTGPETGITEKTALKMGEILGKEVKFSCPSAGDLNYLNDASEINYIYTLFPKTPDVYREDLLDERFFKLITKISNSYIARRIRISHIKYTNFIRIHDAKKAPIFSISTKYECLKFKIEPAKPHFATSMTIHRGKLIFSIKSIALRREPSKTNGFVVLSGQGWTHLNVYGFP